MTAPIVVLDTETSGLHPVLDDIWEFAALRREPDGTERELHLFIEHNEQRCELLPEPFWRDHVDRWPGPAAATPQPDAAFLIDTFLRGPDGSERAHIVGAVPNFDTERLTRFLDRNLPNFELSRPPWHHHLVDVENLAVGYLRARFPDIPMHPPWESDLLSEAVGVDINPDERHTALGDVHWAMRIYNKIMGE